MVIKLAYRNLFHDRLSLAVTLTGILFSVVLAFVASLALPYVSAVFDAAGTEATGRSAAMREVREHGAATPPDHLRDAHYRGAKEPFGHGTGYKYAPTASRTSR